MDKAKINIRRVDLAAIEAYFLSIGEKKFRAKQVYEWLWKKNARHFSEMTNLSIGTRTKLEEDFTLPAVQLDTVQHSEDGTVKFRLKLHDGHLIETVLIPVAREERYTVCVSSQVGCSLTCSFCATGRMKRERNLTPGEIVDQVVFANNESLETYGRPITNIVYMGMGEPLLAYKEVLASIDHLTGTHGWNMAPRRITVSTAGIAKMIKKLADDEVKFNLALSLHAANDTKRNEIMPINNSNNLEVLVEALDYFYQKTKGRITFEYIAFQHFNDGIEDARNLMKLCRRIPAKVNIIEYNPIDNAPFEKSSVHRIDDFASFLRKEKIAVTVRRSRGRDIDAACGQLANK